MGLDISRLKYYNISNGNYFNKSDCSFKSGNDINEEKRRQANELAGNNDKKTDIRLERYKKLKESGLITNIDYYLAILDLTANDIVYQLAVKSMEDNNTEEFDIKEEDKPA